MSDEVSEPLKPGKNEVLPSTTHIHPISPWIVVRRRIDASLRSFYRAEGKRKKDILPPAADIIITPDGHVERNADGTNTYVTADESHTSRVPHPGMTKYKDRRKNPNWPPWPSFITRKKQEK